MRYIAVDDERIVLDSITALIKRVDDSAEVRGFTDDITAIDSLANEPADVALLDIQLPETSGIELAKKCKDLCPQINIIFVTGYSNYVMDAMRLRASGYLMKPVMEESLRLELDNLRNPPLHKPDRLLRVQTFGNFDVFFNGVPLAFPRSKTKEIFAYLIDRQGASVTVSELAAIVWPDGIYDRSRQKQIHVFTGELFSVLKGIGLETVIVKQHKSLAVSKNMIDCDYYRFLNGEVEAINSYAGEYMRQYEWAEFTAAWLEQKSNGSN